MVDSSEWHAQVLVLAYNFTATNVYVVSRAVRPCQEYHLDSVVSFVGWGGMIFASSTQDSGSEPQAMLRRLSADVAVLLSPAMLDRICPCR